MRISDVEVEGGKRCRSATRCGERKLAWAVNDVDFEMESSTGKFECRESEVRGLKWSKAQ